DGLGDRAGPAPEAGPLPFRRGFRREFGPADLSGATGGRRPCPPPPSRAVSCPSPLPANQTRPRPSRPKRHCHVLVRDCGHYDNISDETIPGAVPGSYLTGREGRTGSMSEPFLRAGPPPRDSFSGGGYIRTGSFCVVGIELDGRALNAVGFWAF